MLDVGVRVRELRQRRGWTQADLARHLNVSRAWVVRLEQGASRLEAQLVLDALVALGSPLTTGDALSEPSDDDPFAGVFEDLSS
jgi:transcriptional regulator with XRE-family HTH domain